MFRLFSGDTRLNIEAIVEFRRRSFAAAGNLDPSTAGVDGYYDQLANCRQFGLACGDEMVGVIRHHLVLPSNRISPAYNVFGDILDPQLDQGFCILDSSGFTVSRMDLHDRINVTTKLIATSIYAAKHFRPSRLIATVREKHIGFYTRFLGGEVVCGPRYYPGRLAPLALVMQDTDSTLDRMRVSKMERYVMGDLERAVVDKAWSICHGNDD